MKTNGLPCCRRWSSSSRARSRSDGVEAVRRVAAPLGAGQQVEHVLAVVGARLEDLAGRLHRRQRTELAERVLSRTGRLREPVGLGLEARQRGVPLLHQAAHRDIRSELDDAVAEDQPGEGLPVRGAECAEGEGRGGGHEAIGMVGTRSISRSSIEI